MGEQNGVSVSELKSNEALASLMEVGRVHEQMGVELVELRNENDSLRHENGILRHEGERQAKELARLTLEHRRSAEENVRLAQLTADAESALDAIGSLLHKKAEDMRALRSGASPIADNVERLRAVKTG